MVSITWIAAKLFLKKAWTWIKNYWYVPAVFVYTVVVWIVSRRNGAAALEVLAASTRSYEDQIKVLKDSHEVEVGKRDKALRDYEAQKKAGVTTYTFDPKKLGIKNADFWENKK